MGDMCISCLCVVTESCYCPDCNDGPFCATCLEEHLCPTDTEEDETEGEFDDLLNGNLD